MDSARLGNAAGPGHSIRFRSNWTKVQYPCLERPSTKRDEKRTPCTMKEGFVETAQVGAAAPKRTAQ
jgi:hypothetical protein